MGGHGSSEDTPCTTGERATGHLSGLGTGTPFFPYLSFPLRTLPSASNKLPLALFSLRHLEDGHKRWKNTQLGHFDHLCQKSSLGPIGPFPAILAVKEKAGEEGIPGDFYRPVHLPPQPQHSICTWGTLGQVCRVLVGQLRAASACVRPSLPGPAQCGHSQGAAWQAARLSGNVATTETCVWSRMKFH